MAAVLRWCHLTPGEHAELVAVHTGPDGVDDGYVHYRVKWDDVEFGHGRGRGDLIELIASSTAVELALWTYVCDLDLVRTWTAQERPLDDAVRLAVADRRAYQVRLTYDEQWLRLLDVDAVLGARTYGDAVDGVTIAVRDELFPENTGVWRIESKGAARHEADPSGADLATDVATLAAAYLGGTRWSLLAELDLVEERTPGSARPGRHPVRHTAHPVLRQLLLTVPQSGRDLRHGRIWAGSFPPVAKMPAQIPSC